MIVENEPLDVRIRVSSISGDGKVRIGFNQELNVPNFNENSNGRLLKGTISFQDFDVQRDLLDFSFILNSGVEQKPAYFLELTDWKPYFIEVYMNFTDPLIISKGVKLD